MENDIFFIDTPVEIQDEIYYDIIAHLEEYNIPENKIIYLKMTPIINLIGKYYFHVFIEDTIVDHSLLRRAPDFLIFL